MVTGGAKLGRTGVITNWERHPGPSEVVHVKDVNGNSFATQLSNIFVIGKVSLGFSSPGKPVKCWDCSSWFLLKCYKIKPPLG